MALLSCSCGRVFIVIVFAFLAYQVYVFYTFVATASCDSIQTGRCLVPAYKSKTRLQVLIMSSNKKIINKTIFIYSVNFSVQLWILYTKYKDSSRIFKGNAILEALDLNRNEPFTK